ncbi:Aspartic proteinase nepenthesin-2 precursor, putative [Ricinus communis]|uniref:Aspartic proteinase nepenthesin-2, putative n=1 Tax=Ricinus communis TaxID=3988 RepID=B9RNR9_RICCO|nr:Aspartic proteinase nepenthesin-2 precursor, putative [Ricinus communis]
MIDHVGKIGELNRNEEEGSDNGVSFIKHFLSLWLLFSFNNCYAFEGRKFAESQHTHTTIHLTSLLPAASCKPSTQVPSIENKAFLKVVHKHGPCSDLRQGHKAEAQYILLQDQSRVDSIHSKLSKDSGLSDVKATAATTLPAKDGSIIGSGNYFVTVGLGTPKKDFSLIFDTGSDLTWTQCEPCVKSCYNQKEAIFNPSQSTSYANISCGSTLCDSLASATGNIFNCASSTCVYGIQYGDSSFSIGFFGKEKLSLTATDVFNDFYFGCGQNNKGLFGGAAGLLGLGRDKLSLVSQTAQRYNKIFSYCLPSSSSSTGFLTFGGSTSKSASFTPLATISGGSSFYGLDLTGISVGGRKLAISPSVFSTAGTIIDSGTVITRLPPAAYSALSSTFRKLMSQYPAAPALSILDTCFDFSNHDTISVPKIGLFFSGGVVVDIDKTGIFYVNDLTQVCLAFAGNSDASDVAIFGNVQQKTLEVVYDGAAGRVGFAPAGCS